MANQLIPTGVGSTDWAGGRAPTGGTHTGVGVITMNDGTQYTVAHDRAEIIRKMDPHATPQTTPRWVAFDVLTAAVPVVLDVAQVQLVV